MSLPPILPRCACTACLVTVLAMAVGVPSAASQDSGCVTVTGGSVQTIRITVEDGPDDVRTFRPADDPDQASRLLAFVAASEGAGSRTCYALSASITVSSNVPYDVVVSGRATVSSPRFLGGRPSSYATCAGGEPVSDAMFPAADPPGGWIVWHPRTPRQVHPLAVSVIAGPADDPLALLAAAQLTVLVRASE